MANLKIFLVLTFFVYMFCQSSASKDGQHNFSTSTTDKTVTEATQNLPDTAPGTFVARLKDGIKKVNAIINDSIIFVATKGQLFVYENISHNAWIADGRFAYIPPEQVVKVNKAYFKFNFSKWDFVKGKDYELTQAARRVNIDLNSLIKKVRNKNNDALKTFFDLHDNIDGAAAEEFDYDFWALINVWPDIKLSSFLKSLNKSNKKAFANLLFETAFLVNVTSYYQLYYPKTLKEIKNIE